MGGGIYYNYKTKIAGVAQGQSIPLVRERSWVRIPPPAYRRWVRTHIKPTSEYQTNLNESEEIIV
jgi:hypothetical protein